ncbi:hypothetical protein NDU88_006364 [Pleurodeles waltl]|uniref:Uncharacterized protein n=1 Tax=Pleurodeles waltl TaxID=8319 RepID=A0AAV7X1G4_PLEWA|nr:hypothetical protein NDU88_006364 [Pleurodeles waltl]
MALGDICSEHEQLGLHVSMEVKEKIWKGAYIVIFDLEMDKYGKEKVKSCKECAHSRDCGNWTHRKTVDKPLVNSVSVFSTYQAIAAEHFNDLGAQLAYYQNRIVGAHDEYGGTAWKDYDEEFRWIKANRATLG